MDDLLVIGGGFWGRAVALEARKHGFKVRLLDSGAPTAASRNAAGIIQMGWFRGDHMRRYLGADLTARDADAGVEWLMAYGILHQTGELYHNYRTLAPFKFRPDCYLLDSLAAFMDLIPAETATIQRLRKIDGGWEAESLDSWYESRQVVLALGAATDVLLQASGLQIAGIRPLRGRALILRHPTPPEVPMTWTVAPYRDWTARAWGEGTLRIGDTVERTAHNTTILAGLRTFVQQQPELAGAVECGLLDGNRPLGDTMLVRQWEPGLIVATGGHRVGLGLAGGVAKKVMRLLQ